MRRAIGRMKREKSFSKKQRFLRLGGRQTSWTGLGQQPKSAAELKGSIFICF